MLQIAGAEPVMANVGRLEHVRKYWISLFTSILSSALALYATLFFAWRTATPLSSAQLARAKYDCYSWFGIFAVSVSLAIVILTRIIWLHRRLRHKGLA